MIYPVNQIAITAGLLLVMISNIALINGESLYLGGENSLEGVNHVLQITAGNLYDFEIPLQIQVQDRWRLQSIEKTGYLRCVK